MPDDVYRIRTSRPVLWRTPSSVQVGVDDPPLVVENIPDRAAPLLHALQSGVSTDGFELLAQQLRVPLSSAHHLANSFSPAFHTDPSEPKPRFIVTGPGVARRIVADTLRSWGFVATLASHPRPSQSKAIHLLVADYVIDPQWLPRYGAGRSRHLPLVFSDRSITAGPLITPGSTPCLSCRELFLRENNPHWLALGSQLWGTTAPTSTEPLARLSAMLVAVSVGQMKIPAVAGNSGPLIVRFSPASETLSAESAAFHPDCRCRGL